MFLKKTASGVSNPSAAVLIIPASEEGIISLVYNKRRTAMAKSKIPDTSGA